MPPAGRPGRGRKWAAVVLLLLLPYGIAQFDDGDDAFNRGGGVAVPFFTQAVYNGIMNVTTGFVSDFSKSLDFCVKDPNKDWNGAFNFSSDLTFLENCIKQTKGDLTQRMCTAGEIKFYFSSFTDMGAKTSFLRPNKNCNLTSWVSGCEPGWACSVGQDKKVNLRDANVMPDRTLSCRPCCEGFFCPKGLTCMIHY